MTKNLEYILYGLTLIYCFTIACTGMGDTSHIELYIGQRALFYIVEIVLLLIAMKRCRKLYSNYDYDYFKKTEKILAAADCCFVMIAIVMVFSIAEMIVIFVFLPKRVFEFGAANGLLVLMLISGFVFLFYTFVAKRFQIIKKKKEEMRHPLGKKTEDFYAFIHSADEKQEKEWVELHDEDMPDASFLLDEIVPTEKESDRHSQKIAIQKPLPEPIQLWECPCCGSLNPIDCRKCDFCGFESEH